MEWLDFQNAYHLLNAAQQSTDNAEFTKVKALLERCQKLHNLANEVVDAFPSQGDAYPGHYGDKSLQQKATERVGKTRELISLVKELNQKEAA